MNIFENIDSNLVQKAVKKIGLDVDTDLSTIDFEKQHEIMSTIAGSLLLDTKKPKIKEYTFQDWIFDNIDELIKNHIALEVYEKTLSHKVMPTEDWKIAIHSREVSPDKSEWLYDWEVVVDTQPALITGTMGISFDTVISLCMKAALSR